MRILRHNPQDAADDTSLRPTMIDVCNSYHDLRALTVNEHCVYDHVLGSDTERTPNERTNNLMCGIVYHVLEGRRITTVAVPYDLLTCALAV